MLKSNSKAKFINHIKKEKITKYVFYLILLAFSIAALFPIYWMFVTAFKYSEDIFSSGINLVPNRVSWGNFKSLFNAINVWRGLYNSVFIAMTGTLAMILLTSLTGFGLAKFSFPGQGVLLIFVMATMMVPGEIMMVPVYRMVANMGLIDTYWAVLLPMILGTMPGMGIFFMRQYISKLPDSLIESAHIDGANYLRIYFSIILPIIKPAIALISITTFMGLWNSYIWPALVLRSAKMWTLMVALPMIKTSEFLTPWGVMLAGSTIAIIPMIIAFVMFEDLFIDSLTMGASKG